MKSVCGYLLSSILFCPVLAFASLDGTYICKNSDPALPDNEVKVRSIAVGNSNDKVPYVEVTHHYVEAVPSNNPVVKISTVKGIAAVSTVDRFTYLIVGKFTLTFENDKLGKCVKI